MPFAFHCDSNCESLQETDRDWRRVSMWFSSIYLSLCFSLLSFFINSPRHILFMIAYQYEIPIDNTCFPFFFLLYFLIEIGRWSIKWHCIVRIQNKLEFENWIVALKCIRVKMHSTQTFICSFIITIHIMRANGPIRPFGNEILKNSF